MSDQQIVSSEHDREAWLRWRKGGIGSSDAAVLCGHGFKKNGRKVTPLDLYVEKTTEALDLSDSLILERGRELEPIAARRYSRVTGRTLLSVAGRVHRDHDFMRASVDREVLPMGGEPVRQVELKTMFAQPFAKLPLDGLPMRVWIQVQQQLEVSDCDLGSVGVLQPDSWKFLHFDIERDREFGARLIEVEAEFWQRVLDRRPPLPESFGPSPADDFEDDCGGELVHVDSLNAELALTYTNLSQALVTAKSIKKEAEEFHDDVAERMKAWLDKNGFDAVEGCGIFTYWREQDGRMSFDKKALAAEHPEIVLSRYEKRGKPFRSLRIFDKSLKLTEGGF